MYKSDLSYNPKLNVKILNFDNSPIEYCIFNNVNISCYEPHTCKSIIFKDTDFPDKEAENYVKQCTNEEIDTILSPMGNKLSYNNNKLNSLLCIIVGSIISFIMGILVTLMFVKKYKSSKSKSKLKSERLNNTSTPVTNSIFIELQSISTIHPDQSLCSLDTSEVISNNNNNSNISHNTIEKTDKNKSNINQNIIDKSNNNSNNRRSTFDRINLNRNNNGLTSINICRKTPNILNLNQNQNQNMNQNNNNKNIMVNLGDVIQDIYQDESYSYSLSFLSSPRSLLSSPSMLK